MFYKIVRSGMVAGKRSIRNGIVYFDDKPAHGKFDDGVAIYYYYHGNLHREDGPAVQFYNRDRTRIWYLQGNFQRGESRAAISCKSFICDGVKQKVTHVKEIWDKSGKLFYEFYRTHKLLLRTEQKV